MTRPSNGVSPTACSPEQNRVRADAPTVDRTCRQKPQAGVLSARDPGADGGEGQATSPPDGQSFDLVSYARRHGYRTRNMHDGAPVPPTRRLSEQDRTAYRSTEDRDDAIICRDGYADFGGFGLDRIGFCVLCRSRRALTVRLRLLANAGATVTQEGDTEAAGYAPLARIDDVLTALRPYRRREAPDELVKKSALGSRECHVRVSDPTLRWSKMVFPEQVLGKIHKLGWR